MRVLLLIALILLGLYLWNCNQNNTIPNFTDEMNSIICIQEEI